MGLAEKFCLKWSDFSSNLISSFSEQKESSNFTDVTLACDDQSQLTAHRVLLAASSSFFREIMTKQKHPDLLIYMRGIKSQDLNGLLDFMYHGEVNIYQEDLDEFLALANDLGIEGLKGVSFRKNLKPEEEQNSVQNFDKFNTKKEIKIFNELFNYIEPKHSTFEGNSSLVVTSGFVDYNETLESKETEHLADRSKKAKAKKKMKMVGEMFNSEKSEHTNFSQSSSIVVMNDTVDYKELDEQIMSMMEKREGQWTCTMCGKTQSKINIQQHVEGVHIKDGAHSCNQCGKILKSRKALRNHTEIHNK